MRSSKSRTRLSLCRICGEILPKGKVSLCGEGNCVRLARNEKQSAWYRKARRLGTMKKRKKVISVKNCRECARTYESRGFYCSKACRLSKNRRNAQEYYRRKRVMVVLPARAPVQCSYCESVFVPLHARSIYCSAQCVRKRERDQRSVRRILVGGTSMHLREMSVPLKDAALVLRRLSQEVWRRYGRPRRQRQSAA